jgi:hypothetical protein
MCCVSRIQSSIPDIGGGREPLRGMVEKVESDSTDSTVPRRAWPDRRKSPEGYVNLTEGRAHMCAKSGPWGGCL